MTTGLSTNSFFGSDWKRITILKLLVLEITVDDLQFFFTSRHVTSLFNPRSCDTSDDEKDISCIMELVNDRICKEMLDSHSAIMWLIQMVGSAANLPHVKWPMQTANSSFLSKPFFPRWQHCTSKILAAILSFSYRGWYRVVVFGWSWSSLR
jgi:hypothetical protein